MFGKKKAKTIEIAVMHYEGILNFSTDYPCKLVFNDKEIVIRRVKPETTVVLSKDRITSVGVMEELKFMLKYHGNAVTTSKSKAIKKYYLVIDYDKGNLAFWGTAKEYSGFLKIQSSIEETEKQIIL